MTDTQVLVHVDLDGVPVLAGRLWARVRRGRESASFEHEDLAAATGARDRPGAVR